jgi:hypothetical protein
LRHERCGDCHADVHAGQLARRADGGRCESCHDVAGFVPARFGIEEHQRTGFALAGAHLAVPCNACHRPVAPQALARAGVATAASGGAAAGRPTPQLRFAATGCQDCHRDPHRGEVERQLRKGGCQECHSVDSWRALAFDHAQTSYPLSGAHQKAACGGCHKTKEAGTPRARIGFAATPRACEACHADPHRGQFARAGQAASCERCHTTDDTRPTRFDHRRDSSYPLDGAHARVACAGCHVEERKGAAVFVRYRPTPTACRDCHAAEPSVAAGRAGR